MRHYPGVPADAIDDEATYESVRIIDLFCRDASKALKDIDTDITALLTPPILASYVTINNEVSLTNERRLIGTSPITVTDNGAGVSVAVGINESVLRGTPAITYATVGSEGTATTFVATDATLPFPSALMPVGKTDTLTLTSGADQTLTASLGRLKLFSGDDTYEIGTPVPGVDDAGSAHIGIGIIPNINTRLFVQAANTATSASAAALNFAAAATVAHATATVSGILGQFANTGPVDVEGRGMAANIILSGSAPVTVTRPQSGSVNRFDYFFGSAAVFEDVAAFRVVKNIDFSGTFEIANHYGLRIEDFEGSTVVSTNLYGIHSALRAVIESKNAREDDVLTLNQLATDAGDDGAHIMFNSKGTDPTVENEGQLWYNGTNFYFKPSGTKVDILAGGAGGGDSFLEWAGL